MRIEHLPYSGRWIVLRGRNTIHYYNGILVDHDRVSWTTYRPDAHRFVTEQAAQETLAEIRRRTKLRGGK